MLSGLCFLSGLLLTAPFQDGAEPHDAPAAQIEGEPLPSDLFPSLVPS
ncbi:hypothetical protein [Engelhardtia mirabilis]|uniref:Uncharacterized protein n=1 Tax=Engelhardtia mirabilis TaxID=2528011 RepID=A0A518BDW4_9BACT|nr:hypothetical protein Pla133_02420 [Planctomycetes bacterium Pla133]QDU99504.1 hypothetical protein Pla86_02420 [Planctomycetes bacterium Pla86]